jgi:hypothetical protein
MPNFQEKLLASIQMMKLKVNENLIFCQSTKINEITVCYFLSKYDVQYLWYVMSFKWVGGY